MAVTGSGGTDVFGPGVTFPGLGPSNVLLGVVDTIADLYNSAQNRKVARQNTQDTIRANRELAEYSYDKDLEMWNLENQYNSPAQQMARLAAAGLNPNLVYGNGSVSGNTTTSGPRYKAPHLEYNNRAFQIPHIASYLQDFAAKQASIANLKQQNDNLAASADKTRMETKTEALNQLQKAINAMSNKFDYDLKSELRKYTVDTAINDYRRASIDADRAAFGRDYVDRVKFENIKRLNRQLDQDFDIKRYRFGLYRKGFTDSDGFIIRSIGRILMGDAPFINSEGLRRAPVSSPDSDFVTDYQNYMRSLVE